MKEIMYYMQRVVRIVKCLDYFHRIDSVMELDPICLAEEKY